MDDQSNTSKALHDLEAVVTAACPLGDLLSGLWQIYGFSATADRVRIPKRGKTWHELSVDDLNYLREDLEVVHIGLAQQPQEDREVGYDFLCGHQITWTELEMEADIHRDITSGAGADVPDGAGLIQRIREELEGSRNFTILLYHTPGAGGTTVARRLAWDLKESYPTVLLQRYSPATAARISLLYQQTRLPVLVVMENATISTEMRDELYIDLKGHNTRAVFLYVMRSTRYREGFFLSTPMVERETERFLRRYRTARPERASILEALAKDPEMRDYRSPFFFGLYAFEERFVHIPEFVRAHLEELPRTMTQAMEFLAIITRFSQLTLPEDILRRLLGLPDGRQGASPKPWGPVRAGSS